MAKALSIFAIGAGGLAGYLYTPDWIAYSTTIALFVIILSAAAWESIRG